MSPKKQKARVNWTRLGIHGISVTAAVLLFIFGPPAAWAAAGLLLGASGGAEYQRHRGCKACTEPNPGPEPSADG